MSSSTATLDGIYRYDLVRRWRPGPLALFVMLNPSTADAETDDATIRRCRGFAEREDAGGLVVVNLYALRARDPRELEKAEDPIGPRADSYLRLWLGSPDVSVVVAAWGANPAAGRRELAVLGIADELELELFCLGKTAGGAPRHPLYVPRDHPLEPYEGAHHGKP